MSKILEAYEKSVQLRLDNAITELEQALELVKSQDAFFGLAWPTEDRLWKLHNICNRILSEI